MSKIQKVMEVYGYTELDELLADFMMAGAVPGICQDPCCDNIEEYEPDQRNGYCNECGEKYINRDSLKNLLLS